MNLTLPAVAVQGVQATARAWLRRLPAVRRWPSGPGVCEAKQVRVAVPGNVEIQTQKYVEGLPSELDAPHQPLPFAYISTGEETAFINFLDPTRAPRKCSPSTGPTRSAVAVCRYRCTPGSGAMAHMSSLTIANRRRCGRGCERCRWSFCRVCGRTRSKRSRTSKEPV